MFTNLGVHRGRSIRKRKRQPARAVDAQQVKALYEAELATGGDDEQLGRAYCP